MATLTERNGKILLSDSREREILVIPVPVPGIVPSMSSLGADLWAPSGDLTGITDTTLIMAKLGAYGYCRLGYAPASNPFIIRDISGGTATAAITLSDYQGLEGLGEGLTVVKLADSANYNMVGNVDQTVNGNTGCWVRKLTLDGNKANNTQGANRKAISFVYISKATIEFVEAQNCNVGAGVGAVVLNGNSLPNFSRWSRVSFLKTHDNAGVGFKHTSGNRDAHMDHIWAWNNGDDGIVLDASQSMASHLTSYDNTGVGIHVTNVFGCDYSNWHAYTNGKHGIEIYGLVDSVASNLNAHNNSHNFNNTYSDLKMTDDGLNSYGVTKQSVISGVQLGPNSLYATTSEKYCIEFDDAATGEFEINGLRIEAPGVTGSIRRPVAGGSPAVMLRLASHDSLIKSGPVLVGPSNASEITVFDKTIRGGALGHLGAASFEIVGDLIDATGVSTYTYTVRVYAGGTKIYDGTSGVITTNGTRHAFRLRGLFTNRGDEALNQVVMDGGYSNVTAATTGFGVPSSAAGAPAGDGVFGSDQVAIDTKPDWNLKVTIQLSISDPNLGVRVGYGMIEVIPS